MSKSRRAYAPEFRRQLVELVHAGRTSEELAREFKRLYEEGIAARSDHAPVVVDLDLAVRPKKDEETSLTEPHPQHQDRLSGTAEFAALFEMTFSQMTVSFDAFCERQGGLDLPDRVLVDRNAALVRRAQAR